ncbi:MAG: polysaccharide biosynthesis tyrosine autokinase [Ruminococcus sp.]|uniref:polysaccharide biosynthesis tyrosine autokinase n=1 Tax=Ruminococcus sp. TaxID=41978 RepID=UPI0025F9D511|nr:polysaccharide biosynthesis tyrosine autokinase [Ruminococcus sp.]MBR5681845.1 polysaccharide biosynthesis tyrosine autokinase [Ruminococcus sp.]
MKKTYTVSELLRLMREHIRLIAAVALLSGIAVFAFSKYMLPPEYSSHISLYVKNCSESSGSSRKVNDIMISKQLVTTYVELLNDDAVLNAVGDALISKYDASDLKEKIYVNEYGVIPASTIRNLMAIKYSPLTSVIKITVNCNDALLAADICNAIAKSASTYVQSAVGVGSVSVTDIAKVYPDPVGPDIPKNTIIAMISAVLAMFMIILIRDYLNNSIKNTEELEQAFSTPIIGEIKHFGDKKADSGSFLKPDSLISGQKLPFEVVESYKLLRANLLFTIADSGKKVIAVSSAEHGEGKTMTAANISIALAEAGSKVLLVDGDMRVPTLHKTFDVSNNTGLSTLIIKRSSDIISIHSDVLKNLDLLPSGPIPPNPSELLGSENFRKVMERLSQDYDHIIIDTPPLSVVSDAAAMKDAVDGIILVVRHASTTYDKVSECVERIKFANADLLGFVVNEVHAKSKNNYYDY